MRSTINFRDFGGAPSVHAGHVRRDRLFRSGHLAAVTQSDIEQLLGLDFALVADLRYARERERDRSPWPAAYAPRVLFHDGTRSSDAPHIELLKWMRENDGSVHDRAIGFYEQLPRNRRYRALFGNVLTQLAGTDGRLLVHCTAGKDRTGILSALILHVLGVSWDDILADYMLSRGSPGLLEMAAATERELVPHIGPERAHEFASKMFDVDESYLVAAFAVMAKESGSVDGYIASLGLDAQAVASMRSRLLV
jgi:protein tyrosine/serine phosphatase